MANLNFFLYLSVCFMFYSLKLYKRNYMQKESLVLGEDAYGRARQLSTQTHALSVMMEPRAQEQHPPFLQPLWPLGRALRLPSPREREGWYTCFPGLSNNLPHHVHALVPSLSPRELGWRGNP